MRTFYTYIHGFVRVCVAVDKCKTFLEPVVAKGNDIPYQLGD